MQRFESQKFLKENILVGTAIKLHTYCITNRKKQASDTENLFGGKKEGVAYPNLQIFLSIFLEGVFSGRRKQRCSNNHLSPELIVFKDMNKFGASFLKDQCQILRGHKVIYVIGKRRIFFSFFQRFA